MGLKSAEAHGWLGSIRDGCRVVESVGEGVEEVSPGDLVVPTFLGNCGDCAECRSERTNLCAIGFNPTGGLPRSAPSPFAAAEDGAAIHNFLGVSSFAEYTVVDVSQVTLVDPAIPPEKACLLSCGVSTGIRIDQLFIVDFPWNY